MHFHAHLQPEIKEPGEFQVYEDIRVLHGEFHSWSLGGGKAVVELPVRHFQ